MFELYGLFLFYFPYLQIMYSRKNDIHCTFGKFRSIYISVRLSLYVASAHCLQWLGQILCIIDDDRRTQCDKMRMIKISVKYIYYNPRKGNLLMHVPTTSCWYELGIMTQQKDVSQTFVRSLRTPRFSISIGPHFVPDTNSAFTIS